MSISVSENTIVFSDGSTISSANPLTLPYRKRSTSTVNTVVNFSSTSFTTYISNTFTSLRSGSVLVEGHFSPADPNGTTAANSNTFYLIGKILLDGVDISGEQTIMGGLYDSRCHGSFYIVGTANDIAAGSHTVELQIKMNSGSLFLNTADSGDDGVDLLHVTYEG